MVSLLAAQVPLLIVHTKVFTLVSKPVTPVVGLVGFTTVPAPAITVHTPVPIIGVFADIVAVSIQIV
jgi:hypothetical protein